MARAKMPTITQTSDAPPMQTGTIGDATIPTDVLELTPNEPMPPKKPKAKPLTKRTTTRRRTKEAVNDAQRT